MVEFALRRRRQLVARDRLGLLAHAVSLGYFLAHRRHTEDRPLAIKLTGYRLTVGAWNINSIQSAVLLDIASELAMVEDFDHRPALE